MIYFPVLEEVFREGSVYQWEDIYSPMNHLTLAEVMYTSYKNYYSLLATYHVQEKVHSLTLIYMILQGINFPF